MTKTTITISITEETTKRERQAIYVAHLNIVGHPAAAYSTSKKRLEQFMKEDELYKRYPYFIKKVKNI